MTVVYSVLVRDGSGGYIGVSVNPMMPAISPKLTLAHSILQPLNSCPGHDAHREGRAQCSPSTFSSAHPFSSSAAGQYGQGPLKRRSRRGGVVAILPQYLLEVWDWAVISDVWNEGDKRCIEHTATS